MKRPLLFFLVSACLIVPAPAPVDAQTTEPLLSREELRALNNEISGELAQDLTEFVTENNTPALMSESAFAVYSLSGSRDAFRSRIMPYTSGSDQVIFNDSLIAVPFAFFLVWPDRYYHTSGEAVNRLNRALERESAALDSIRQYSARDESIDGYCRETVSKLEAEQPFRLKDLESYYSLCCQARKIRPQEPSLTSAEERAARTVPRREIALKGPVGWGFLREKLKEVPPILNPADFRQTGLVTYEILNFVDGKNSLLDIRNAVSAEFEPVPLQWVEDYIRLLARAGVVILEK
jgi:hypothetical protein